MSRRRRRRQTLLSLVFILAVVALAIWAGNFAGPNVLGDSLVTTSEPIQTSTPRIVTQSLAIPTPENSQMPKNYDLLIQVKSNGANQLVLLNPETEQRRLIYTDQGESLEIKQIGNLVNNEVLAIMGSKGLDFGGSLWTIRLDGTGQATKLIDDFAWALVTAIAFGLQASAGAGGEILTIPLAGGTPKTLASFTNRLPYDLAWASDGSLAFIDGPGWQGDLFELAKDSTEPKKLSSLSGQESRPVYRPDSQFLAFTQTVAGKSTLYLFDRAKGSAKALGSATIVVGWIERGSNE